MTAIAALVHDGRVHMAGDSAGCSGWDLTVRADPKVFTVGPYVFGFTGSFRMGQLLRHAFTPPEPPGDTGDLHRFMCTSFIDAVRDCLKEGGYARKDSEQEQGGTFLIGVRGRLFAVESDYQVGEPADSFAAVGCGAAVVHGALHATAGLNLSPAARLTGALQAAERFSNGVRGPFVTVAEPGEATPARLLFTQPAPAPDDQEPARPARRETGAAGVGMPALLHLDAFGREIDEAFGRRPYLVGSAARGKTWRDVDVRLILADEEFDALFPGRAHPGRLNGRWSLLCAAISELGRARTGLPIDFQIQRMTDANDRYDGVRHALGMFPQWDA